MQDACIDSANNLSGDINKDAFLQMRHTATYAEVTKILFCFQQILRLKECKQSMSLHVHHAHEAYTLQFNSACLQ